MIRAAKDLVVRIKPFESSADDVKSENVDRQLVNVYRAALRARGDHEWLGAHRDASPGTLSSRWREVGSGADVQIENPTANAYVDMRVTQADAVPHPAARDLLAQAKAGLVEAKNLKDANERFAVTHLAALRAAAAVLAVRGRPEESKRHRARIRSAWEILPEVAPELAEWGHLFAAGAERRARAEAGIPNAASAREADDLWRDADMFIRLVERLLVATRPVRFMVSVPVAAAVPDLLEVSENLNTGSAVRHLSHGFDDLFRALGPPPPGLRSQQSVSDGGGGAVG
jgi:hypothetical protein